MISLDVQKYCSVVFSDLFVYATLRMVFKFYNFHIQICTSVLAYISSHYLLSWALYLTLNAPITTKVVCLYRLLKCFWSLYAKQYGPRSDCSYRSSLFWVQAVCFYAWFTSNVWQLFAADDFSRRHFQMHFFLGALRVNSTSFCDSAIPGYFLQLNI